MYGISDAGSVIAIIFGTFGLVLGIGAVIRLLSMKYAKERSERGIVVNKQSFDVDVLGKEGFLHSEKRYVLSFMCGRNRRDFFVKSAMYDSCRIGERGIVKYKGREFIDFTSE